MYSIHLIIATIVFVDCCYSTTRIYFSACAKNGFTCTTNFQDPKKTDLVYQCPSGVNDILFFINQFSAPSNIATLHIKDCRNLTLSTRCSGDNRPIQKLTVSYITHLVLQRLQYDPMLPPEVTFQFITKIDSIPSKTFGQINKSFYTVGCYNQPNDFHSLVFRNVSIGVVQTDAFVGLNHFKMFHFAHVIIDRVQTGGIKVRQALDGVFKMEKCTINEVEHLALQIYGRECDFIHNKFNEISSSGINGTMQRFNFTFNHVGTLQPHAFSILATNIHIQDNEFLHIKSLALERLSPGLLQDSGMNFGKLKFKYIFYNNRLHQLDALSLHPDFTAYENVQTEMEFAQNNISCYCSNVGWMFKVDEQLEPFYDMVVDGEYGNFCDACGVGLGELAKLVKCGGCAVDLCLKLETNEQVTKVIEDDFSFLIPQDYAHSGAGLTSVYVYSLLICLLMQ